MTDQEIIERFFARDEDAIRQLDRQYGSQCRTLAGRILRNREDAEECINESYYRLWERIPPERPGSLWAYLSRVLRNLSLDRLREQGSLRRGGGAVTVALEELSQVCGSGSAEDVVSAAELGKAVERCLKTLPQLNCDVFLRRYFFFESRSEIAARYGISEAQVSVRLSRARKKLAEYLRQEGYV